MRQNKRPSCCDTSKSTKSKKMLNFDQNVKLNNEFSLIMLAIALLTGSRRMIKISV